MNVKKTAKDKHRMADQLSRARIIVTGCGFKAVETIFQDEINHEISHDSVTIEGVEMKLNIGSATALALAMRGATIHMVSKTERKLEQLRKSFVEQFGIAEESIEYSAVDLLDESAVADFTQKIPKEKTIWLVQSVGLGASSYELKDNNPYLRIEDISIELLEKESSTILRSTHLLMQKLLPIFRKQNKKFNQETKVVIVSSMSAIRGYGLGGTHCAAKGAISRYTNAAMLELWKEKIYVTDVRPGAIDTGLYDNDEVMKAVLTIDQEYGGHWNGKKTAIRLAPPSAIGETISTIFSLPAHITSINMVAQGQFPNERS